ncbi:hypothetical protein cypCar_00043003 [Cyprinus carpio]|nr:hypothetical protein cypCar_00043003 [Cyprinus carpio]
MDDSCWESSDYEILAEIGQGAYGKVYKARERRGQQRFIAVKRLNIPEEPESGIPQFVIREVALLRKIEHFNHPNIVKPLFRGFTEIQQLQKIFEVIGLPGEEDWPIESPVCYSPAWAEKKPTKQLLPSLAHEENDLLSQFLAFNPVHRISACRALAHPFLADCNSEDE